MRDRADLTPAAQAGIGIQPDNHRLDRVTCFAISHIIGLMAGQRTMPQ